MLFPKRAGINRSHDFTEHVGLDWRAKEGFSRNVVSFKICMVSNSCYLLLPAKSLGILLKFLPSCILAWGNFLKRVQKSKIQYLLLCCISPSPKRNSVKQCTLVPHKMEFGIMTHACKSGSESFNSCLVCSFQPLGLYRISCLGNLWSLYG